VWYQRRIRLVIHPRISAPYAFSKATSGAAQASGIDRDSHYAWPKNGANDARAFGDAEKYRDRFHRSKRPGNLIQPHPSTMSTPELVTEVDALLAKIKSKAVA
jgi:hypothetical protein